MLRKANMQKSKNGKLETISNDMKYEKKSSNLIWRLVKINLQLPRSPQPRSSMPFWPVSFSASSITSVVFLGSSRGLTSNKLYSKSESSKNQEKESNYQPKM